MKKNMRKDLSLILAVCIPALLIAVGCKEKKTYTAPPPPSVTVDCPTQRQVTEYAHFTGTTAARKAIEIRARVEGTLQQVHFRDGERIRKGDLLFTIDPKPFQARLNQALADKQLKLAELKLAETTLKRRQNAFQDKAVSEVEVIGALARADSAKAGVTAAEAAIEIARLDLSYTKIHAPITGRISRSLVDPGNLVGAAEQTLLTTLVDDTKLYVYFHASDAELSGCLSRTGITGPENESGPPVSAFLTLGNGKGYSHPGHLDFMDNQMDTATGTIQVRGIFPNPSHTLLPGVFVHIKIPAGSPTKALLIPEEALGYDQQGSYVLVTNNKNIVEYRPVTLGPRIDNACIVKEGLKETDRVIVRGIQRARPGLSVTPSQTDAAKTVKKRTSQPGGKERSNA